MAIEHRVALAPGDGPIVPRLARQIGPLNRLAGGLRRRLIALIASLHGVVSASTCAACSAIAASSISVAGAGTRVAIGRGQVVVQLLEIIAWN